MESNLSPADAYSQFLQRQSEAGSPLEAFRRSLDYELDDFQLRACRSLQDDHSVLVAAPTGAGKTVVAQFSIALAVARGVRVFYTAPIKALSNQKFNELVEAYGADRVGLLTGDTSINRDAQIVVMTTEVLRNMIYSGTDLSELGFVVLDEVHYLGDRFRGPVWEEVIIHLPAHVLLVSLSATVSNAEEFGAWLAEVRGTTDIIVSEHRPVPLHNHVAVGTDLMPLFAPNGKDINKGLEAAVRPYSGFGSRRDRRRGGARHRFMRPARAAVIAELDKLSLLPAIFFIFSRKGCDEALDHCLAAGLDLTTKNEKRKIAAALEELEESLVAEDLGVLGFRSFAAGLMSGFGVHHAGLIPQFKELVEKLFVEGLMRVVFATETLALGINMPARSVVLDKLKKFNGESHVQITPGEYTQLTGRAGRRGIDIEGHAVTVWHPTIEVADIASLASKRTYALNSRFVPTYNMAANLLARMTHDDARKVLETSFAQYQADSSVVGLAKRVRKTDEALAGYREAAQCDRGDFSEYFGYRLSIAQMEKQAGKQRTKLKQRDVVESLSHLQFGSVILLPSRLKFGACVVLNPMHNDHTGLRLPTVLTSAGKVWHLRPHEVTEPAVSLGKIKSPRKFNHRNPRERNRLLDILDQAIEQGRVKDPATVQVRKTKGPKVGSEDVDALRQQMRAHPCHECPEREQHARWAERAHRLERDRAKLTSQITSRTSSIAEVFDRVCSVLRTLEFLPDDTAILRRIYGDRDLLIAMSVRAGLWEGLTEPEAAAMASCLVYESRRELLTHTRMPTQTLRQSVGALEDLWRTLAKTESDAHTAITPEPESGIAVPIYRWTDGKNLAAALEGTDISAGDFVRWAKQTLDVLGQIENVVGPESAETIARAADAMRRGVIMDHY